MDDDIESGWIEPDLRIFEVQNNVKNRRMFRTIARDICGESMEPKDTSLVLFGELKTGETKCVAACQIANESVTDPENREYYHWIEFLFVHKFCQGKGYGSIMLTQIEQKLRMKLIRPIRVDSAERAIGFFRKQGYQAIGNQVMHVFPSCHLFRVLQLMQKFNT